MENFLVQNNQIIRAGNYLIHIGTYKTTDVAIISKFTGEFVKFKDIRKGGKLAKLKRKFKNSLCSSETFNFSFVQPEKVQEIINILKN